MPVRPIEPYLAPLRALPFVRELGVVQATPKHALDAWLDVGTPHGTTRFGLQVKTGNLSDAHIAELAALRRGRTPLMLLAPLIGEAHAERLRQLEIAFVDLRGNCSVGIGKRYLAWIQGRRGETRREPKDIRFPGYKVMFGVLAERELVNASLRTIAEKTDVSRQAAADMLRRLDQEELLLRVRGKRVWSGAGRRELLDRWLAAYPGQVRPRLLVGRFRTRAADPDQLAAQVTRALRATPDWCWTGASAAWRLDPYYRGDAVSLQVAGDPTAILKLLGAVPDRKGPLVVLRSLAPLAMRGLGQQNAHPLLVYSELLASHDERAAEAAGRLHEKFWQA